MGRSHRQAASSIHRLSLLAICGALKCMTAQTAPAVAPGLELDNSVMVIGKDGGEASPNVKICNKSGSSITLNLTLSDFIAADGIRRTAVLKGVPPVPNIFGQSLAASTCRTIQVSMSGLEQVAAASAQFSNGGLLIGTVTLARDHTPYSLSVDGMPSDKPEVRLFRYQPQGVFEQNESRLSIKNSDPWAYALRLSVDVDGTYCQTEPPDNTLNIKPNSSLDVYVKCKDGLFNPFTTGFLKSDTRIAQVPVSVIVPGTGHVLAMKRIPITAVLSYYPEWFQQFANGFWSIGILIIGALLSVFVTIVLPSYSRRVELRRRLAPMEKALEPPDKIRAAESSLSSPDHERARTLLEMECGRLQDILKTIWPFSMNAGVMLDEVQLKTDLLERKVALFSRVEAALLATVDLNAGRLPPSVLDRVNLHCATGVTILLRDSLTSDEWTKLGTLIADSEFLLANTGEHLDWLETNIVAIEAGVQKTLCGDDKKLIKPVREPWSSLCYDLLETVPGMADEPFFPSQYAMRDRRATLFTYVERYEALQALPASAGDKCARDHAKVEFQNACKRRPFDLVRARQFIDQLESDVSPEDLIKEIGKGNVQIWPKDATVPAFSLVRFQVIFPDTPRYNTTPSQHQIGVLWKFSDRTDKNGWNVWQCFPKRKGHYDISVQFLDKTRSQQVVPITSNGKPIVIEATATAERQPAHMINESKGLDILRFVLAVLTATFALTGVRQILPTADAFSATIGALALGFGADTFKNLITSKK